MNCVTFTSKTPQILKPVYTAYCGLYNLIENWYWTRDVNDRDRDETETSASRDRDVDNFSRDETETRRWYVSRPRRRDRDVETETTILISRASSGSHQHRHSFYHIEFWVLSLPATESSLPHRISAVTQPTEVKVQAATPALVTAEIHPHPTSPSTASASIA